MDEITKIKIEHEISRIEKSLKDVKPLLDLCKIREPDIIEMIASAQVLHSFYNGVEAIIVLFFKYLNETLPNDFKWHKTLLEMAFGQNTKNVSIIKNEMKMVLDKYLTFRHFIRYSYGSELEWTEMEPLVNGLGEVWESIKNDFEDFIKNN